LAAASEPPVQSIPIKGRSKILQAKKKKIQKHTRKTY